MTRKGRKDFDSDLLSDFVPFVNFVVRYILLITGFRTHPARQEPRPPVFETDGD